MHKQERSEHQDKKQFLRISIEGRNSARSQYEVIQIKNILTSQEKYRKWKSKYNAFKILMKFRIVPWINYLLNVREM